jgi:ABC-2 type transport system permease protein
VAGYLGMLLMGGAFISFGILFSSLTKNQIVAGFLSFGVFLFLYILEVAENWVTFGSFFSYLSVTKHIEDFAKGVIDTKDVIYYLSFIGFGLFLSKQSVESHRWRG